MYIYIYTHTYIYIYVSFYICMQLQLTRDSIEQLLRPPRAFNHPQVPAHVRETAVLKRLLPHV